MATGKVAPDAALAAEVAELKKTVAELAAFAVGKRPLEGSCGSSTAPGIVRSATTPALDALDASARRVYNASAVSAADVESYRAAIAGADIGEPLRAALLAHFEPIASWALHEVELRRIDREAREKRVTRDRADIRRALHVATDRDAGTLVVWIGGDASKAWTRCPVGAPVHPDDIAALAGSIDQRVARALEKYLTNGEPVVSWLLAKLREMGAAPQLLDNGHRMWWSMPGSKECAGPLDRLLAWVTNEPVAVAKIDSWLAAVGLDKIEVIDDGPGGTREKITAAQAVRRMVRTGDPMKGAVSVTPLGVGAAMPG